MVKFTGGDQLRETLKRLGFTIGMEPLQASHNHCNWIAYRRTERPSNEGNTGKPVQLVVNPYKYGVWENSEVSITGEVNGRSFKLLCDNVDPDQLIEQLPTIEAELVAAWNALQT